MTFGRGRNCSRLPGVPPNPAIPGAAGTASDGSASTVSRPLELEHSPIGRMQEWPDNNDNDGNTTENHPQ